MFCFQERFTQDTQPHYIYSPREMTRWVRGIFEALRPLETLPVEGLIRIWAHEALRLFQDRYGFFFEGFFFVFVLVALYSYKFYRIPGMDISCIVTLVQLVTIHTPYPAHAPKSMDLRN